MTRVMRIVPVIAILVIFIPLYWLSTAKEPAGYADSDELLTVSYLGGVAHPPGYALLTLMTHDLMRLFSTVPPSYIGNLFSGFLQVVALILFYLSVLKLCALLGLKTSRWLIRVTALTATGLLGLSYLWWLYATIFEIGPLTNVFLGLTLYSLLKWYPNSTRWGWLACLAIGLGISHYYPFILLLPGLVLFFLLLGKPQKLWVVLIGLILILTGYLAGVVPLSSLNHHQAAVSWYFDQSLGGLWHHLSRQDFSVYSYAQGRDFRGLNLAIFSPLRFLAATGHYFLYLSQHLGLLSLSFGFIGLYVGLKQRWRLMIPFLTMWGIAGLLFGCYVDESTRDFERSLFTGIAQRQYFLGEWLWMLFAAVGLFVIYRSISRHVSPYIPVIIWCLSLGLLGWLGWYNRSILLDHHTRQATASYAHQVLTQAASPSLVICMSDIDCYSLLYANTVEHLKPAVTVMPYAATYRIYYLAQHPELYPYKDVDEPDFLPQLIAWNVPRQPVYVTQGINFYPDYIGLESGPFYLQPVSGGVPLFRVLVTYPQAPVIHAPLISWPSNPDWRDYYGQGVNEVWSNIFAYQGYLELRYGLPAVTSSLQTALAIDPANLQAQDLLAHQPSIATQISVSPIVKPAAMYLEEAARNLEQHNLESAITGYRYASYLEPINIDILKQLAAAYTQAGISDRATAINQHIETLRIVAPRHTPRK